MIEKRTFRIAVIAVATAAVLVIAAYLFGTGLRADTSASPAALAKSRSDFYADLNNSAAAAASSSAGLSAAEYAAKSGVPAASVIMPESVGARSSAADPYRYEWMGFTSPEFVGAKSSAIKSSVSLDSAVAQFQWIKPEGIKASGAVNSAAGQYQWIKPKGAEASGAK